MKDGSATLDMVGWMGRTALELVGQGGLGHSFDPLIEDTQDEYTEAVKGFSCVSYTHLSTAIKLTWFT